MNPEDFWDLEPSELLLAIKGYNKEKESEGREEWERFRMLATTLVNLQVKKPMKTKELWPFDWDRPTELKEIEGPTPEQIQAIKDKFKLK